MALIVVDVAGAVQICDYLPLQADKVGEHIVIEPLHLSESGLKELEILLLCRDILVADVLQVPKGLKGFLQGSTLGYDSICG